MTASSNPTPKPSPKAAKPAEDSTSAPAGGRHAAQSETAKTDTAKVDTAKVDTAEKSEPAKVDTSKADTAKKSEPAKAEAATKSEPAKKGEPAKPPLTKPLGATVPAAPAKPAGATGGRVAEVVEPSVGQLVSDATTHLSDLVHSEIELAKLELRSTVKNAGTGIGLFGAAAVVLIFSLTFGFFALAEGIAALGLDRWLAFLIVFALQLVAVAVAVYLGIKKVKRVKAPARTIKTTRETVDYLKKSRG